MGAFSRILLKVGKLSFAILWLEFVLKSLSRFSSILVDRFHVKSEARASKDEEWATIEKRRGSGKGSKIFLSDDLTWADWERQREIEGRITPKPFWYSYAHKIAGFSSFNLLERVVSLKNRAVRGWDDRYVFNLGNSLCSSLAEQLEFLADNSHGWPSGERYKSFEEWAEELRLQAAKLRRFNGSVEYDSALERWHSFSYRRDINERDRDRAWRELNRIEASDQRAAEEAMRWVSKNLSHLWS